MGLVHLEHLVRLHHAERIALTAIGDRLPRTLDAACAGLSHDFARFTTPEQMAGSGLDAAVVASRTADHGRDLLAFTRRRIPVLVEKPITSSIEEAAVIERELGAEADRLVQVAFQRHYDEPARAAARWVSQGSIGAIQQSHHVLQDKNPTPVGYDSCGITADMAIHLVYEAMSFRGFALPHRVQALQFMAPPYEDRAGEGANIVHVFCQWTNGSLAHLWGSRINGTGYDNGFTLTGTDGRIDVGAFVGDFGTVTAHLFQGTGAGPIARGTRTASLEFPMTPTRAEHPDFYARYGAAYDRELCAFLDGVTSGAPLHPGLEIAWKTLLVANAAEASSRQQGRIFELARADGQPFASATEAAALAVAT